MAYDGPVLTQQHCDTIDCILQRIQDAREALKKCENCGYPVDSIKADLDEKQKRMEAVKRNFFPNAH